VRHIGLGCILLSTALSSSAVTLGRYSGAAVIGRPLDVRVQALLGPGDDPASLCVQPDVFYGDNQIAPAAVRSSVQRGTGESDASVRVQVALPVDEPVVTVYLRAGCNAVFSRRYVLLADMVSEPAVPAAVTNPVAAAAASAQTPVAAPAPAATAQPAVPSAEGGRTASRPATSAIRGADTSRSSSPRPPSVVRRTAPAPKPAQPRLELDVVDLGLQIERDPALKLSLSLLSEPATSDEARKAAGQLWKAINATPEEILRNDEKLAILEAEAKGLREREARSAAALNDMQLQLEQAKSQRWLTYALGALLGLSLLGMAVLWRRRSTTPGQIGRPAWWQGTEESPAAPTEVATEQALDLDLDLDLGKSRDSGLDSLRPLADSELRESQPPVPPIAKADKREFTPSAMGVSRSVATEELFDIQQQADFFVSLGEVEKAVDVLRNHLAESHEPSPLAYLDLFRLYHQLGRRDDYERLREEFNQVFNAGAPPFDHYNDRGRGLEAYENAFGRIQALWPQPRVLDVIEQSIFRDPGDSGSEVFDLEAYRELLLLHAIAKDVIKRDAAQKTASKDFEHTAIRPLKAARTAVATGAGEDMARPLERPTQPMDDIPPASPRLGLDVDLDELSEISAFEASLPEVKAPVEPTAKAAMPPGAMPQPDVILDNLIDFEMLDFMPPDGGDRPGGAKKH
jgi:hypothetical protein